ncbi:MAG TPA: isoaspartyl peptidase/L-asparaginase [Telluria sp.]
MATTRNGYAVVVHGGVGEPLHYTDGCDAAAAAAVRQLDTGKDALEAAVAAVVSLENDGRFNAGTGAVLALDGETINLDGCVMDSRGTLGVVSSIKFVRNPVLVARDVASSPHVALACDGATQFARVMGHRFYYKPTEQARKTHCEMLDKVMKHEVINQVEGGEYEKYWNFVVPKGFARENGCGSDTVGAVVRDADGNFAVAGSTGGASPALLGRIGDTAMMGSGFYAGPLGAVAATGIGEQIIRKLLAFRVYGWIEGGMPLQEALQKGIELFDRDIEVGLIAVTSTEAACHANKSMPRAKVIQQ